MSNQQNTQDYFKIGLTGDGRDLVSITSFSPPVGAPSWTSAAFGPIHAYRADAPTATPGLQFAYDYLSQGGVIGELLTEGLEQYPTLKSAFEHFMITLRMCASSQANEDDAE